MSRSQTIMTLSAGSSKDEKNQEPHPISFSQAKTKYRGLESTKFYS